MNVSISKMYLNTPVRLCLVTVLSHAKEKHVFSVCALSFASLETIKVII